MTAPLLSAHLCHVLLSQSCRHAWTASPELNPDYEPEESDLMDLGTITHGCLLTGESNVVLLDFPDWRTKLARDSRDAVRASGKTPLLTHKWADVQAMVKAARHQLEAHEPPTPFVGGEAEKSLYFELDGVACRATPDWVNTDHTRIVDLKTTSASAHPGVWARTVWSNGNAVQAAFYRRAVKRGYGKDADFVWIVQETYPPYALSSISLDPEALAFADQEVTEALRLWKACLASGEWPGYPIRTAFAEVPPWVQAQFMERGYYAELPPR